MKIGILTWFFGVNYGARAQSYAMMKILQSKGHEVEFINYRQGRSFKKDLFNACQVENRHKHPIRVLRGFRKLYLFKKQEGDYPKSKEISDVSEMKDLGYDLIILGSDEILNVNHPLFNKVNYGVGISSDIPVVMYAPSAGVTSIGSDIPKDIDDALRCVKNLSARDFITKSLLEKHSGRDVQYVLDPTFLYDFEWKPFKSNDKYILIYSFRFLKEYSKKIREYAKKKGYKIYAVGQVSEWADKSFIDVDLKKWVSLYKGAEMIVTDSYHGFIFSLKYNKEYILAPKYDRVTKIDGLLTSIGIIRGYMDVNDDIEEYLSKEIDYWKVNKWVGKKRTESKEYLYESISTLS